MGRNKNNPKIHYTAAEKQLRNSSKNIYIPECKKCQFFEPILDDKDTVEGFKCTSIGCIWDNNKHFCPKDRESVNNTDCIDCKDCIITNEKDGPNAKIECNFFG